MRRSTRASPSPFRAVARTTRHAVFSALLLGQAGLALADVSPLSVSGNKVLAGGQPASLAGNSLFWSNTGWGGEKFYNANVVKWLKSDWQSKVVRVAMGVEADGGYLADPAGNKARVKAVVEAAIANDLYVIIDWHTHHAEDYRPQAIAFFEEMARTYGKNNHVIYEIYNEPLQVSWSGTLKPYAQSVISAIRAIDPDNLIIMGTPNWSQDVDVASRDRLSGANLAYTLHFYAGSHGQGLRDKAQVALDNGIPLFVTEWGSVSASGDGAVNDGETAAWVDFMKARGISHANWALNDKAEGASALVPGASTQGGWASGQLTRSGTLARQIIRGGSGDAGAAGITVQAESFDVMNGVQTEATTDAGGGLNVGWLDAGDWLSYPSVDIPSAGTYTIEYRVASLNGGGNLALEDAGGSVVHGALGIPSTGGWQNWVTVRQTVPLPAGPRKFGIAVRHGGWNLNWFRITRAS